MSQYQDAISRIDAANAEDPNEVEVAGERVAKEVLYARRMTAWLDELEPDASEPLRLAVRAQHLQRWKIPRDQYPEGRAGYKRWRSDLARMHAERAAEILGEVGYDDETIARVGDLIMKKRLKADPDVQTLEDVACLVFLAHYFPDFASRHDEEKLIDIVKKTWKKMSERGRRAALEIDLPPRERAIVERALGRAPP